MVISASNAAQEYWVRDPKLENYNLVNSHQKLTIKIFGTFANIANIENPRFGKIRDDFLAGWAATIQELGSMFRYLPKPMPDWNIKTISAMPDWNIKTISGDQLYANSYFLLCCRLVDCDFNTNGLKLDERQRNNPNLNYWVCDRHDLGRSNNIFGSSFDSGRPRIYSVFEEYGF